MGAKKGLYVEGKAWERTVTADQQGSAEVPRRMLIGIELKRRWQRRIAEANRREDRRYCRCGNYDELGEDAELCVSW